MIAVRVAVSLRNARAATERVPGYTAVASSLLVERESVAVVWPSPTLPASSGMAGFAPVAPQPSPWSPAGINAPVNIQFAAAAAAGQNNAMPFPPIPGFGVPPPGWNTMHQL